MATTVSPSSVHASNGFTASDHIRTLVDAAVSKFYTQMNEVQVVLHKYEKIPNSEKNTKAEAAKTVQDSWEKAALIVQNLRELRDELQNKESKAVYNFQMNDGVWKNGQALQDIDQHILDRQLRLDSAKQLALQSEQQQRRQVKIKWLYIILFIVLLGATVYMYMWAVGDEIGMHNAKSVKEAIETPKQSDGAPAPSITQSIGNTLGLTTATDQPAEAPVTPPAVAPAAPPSAPPDALPAPATATDNTNDIRGSMGDWFPGGDKSDDSSVSSSSDREDSVSS